MRSGVNGGSVLSTYASRVSSGGLSVSDYGYFGTLSIVGELKFAIVSGFSAVDNVMLGDVVTFAL